jgi:predicted N-acyltransferase
MVDRTVRFHRSWAEVPAAAWDGLVGEGCAFLEHEFLLTAEETGCATAPNGWTPCPITAWEGDRLVGGAPTWLKSHSMGEFVYDFGWADGARRAGYPYYPKLTVAAPFSPVTGRRILWVDEPARSAVLGAIQRASVALPGAHVLFDEALEAARLEDDGWFSRIQYQFHWKNEGYSTFDDFLKRFRSDTRNKIRRERKALAHLRIEVERAPGPDVLSALHALYSLSSSRFGPWGHVYLSREAFLRLGERWGHRLHVVVARDGREIVGGSVNVLKGDRLYGRYWGASADVPFLHFEVCYYKAIEWAIEHGIRVFEPGHGGEHKYRRGFAPSITWSSHRFTDPRLHDAFRRYATEEAATVRLQVEELIDSGPFR